MNNIRVRHVMQSSYLWCLPSGTPSNEALHAEISSWTRSINVMHRSTLALKLQYFMYIKALQHDLSTEFPLSRIVSSGMLLDRALHESFLPMTGQTLCIQWKSSERDPTTTATPGFHILSLIRSWRPTCRSCKCSTREHFGAIWTYTDAFRRPLQSPRGGSTRILVSSVSPQEVSDRVCIRFICPKCINTGTAFLTPTFGTSMRNFGNRWNPLRSASFSLARRPPETSKKMHLDLYKKENLFGRWDHG